MFKQKTILIPQWKYEEIERRARKKNTDVNTLIRSYVREGLESNEDVKMTKIQIGVYLLEKQADEIKNIAYQKNVNQTDVILHYIDECL